MNTVPPTLCIGLQQSQAIANAIYGNFSAPKQQEFVVNKANHLELLRIDEAGKVITICSTPGFCIIRSLATFRLAGSNRDYVVIGSDSGKISIAEYDVPSNSWKLVHCETFGRTGCRRIVPGQYLATDPKGRAIMIAAVEKQKFVYVMNRDASNKLTISSPLEAHKSDAIVFAAVGVDVDFENPIFALIELEYTEVDQDPTGDALSEIEKHLVYYELDLGLNNVVRKWSEPISRTANFLLSVPGGEKWPSGVLICGENWISYKHQGHREIRTAIPRRHNLPMERGILMTSGTVHKMKDTFFFILQSEYGDLYKVTLELDPSNPKVVQDVVVAVFDTIPNANNLCITKTGFLFSAMEFGNHMLLQFQGLDDPNAVVSESVKDEALNEELGDDALSASRVAPLFQASTKLRNLLIIDEVPSLSPVTDMLVVDDFHDRDAKQLYALCGRNHRSSLRVLRHGVTVSEVAVSGLPGKPTSLWSIKRAMTDEYDKYIVVSFITTTLVLSIGDNVEEVNDSGFLTTVATIQVGLLASNVMVQVYAHGLRMIRPDQQVREWKPPNKRTIQYASVNSHQAVIALSGGELIYLELDEAGVLNEVRSYDFHKDITCLDLGVVPEGRVRSMFLAVGFFDDTVELLSLDPRNVLDRVATVPVRAQPSSVALVEMYKEDSYEERSNGTVSKQDGRRSLFLNIGTANGVLVRVSVDQVTGDLGDAREKFLGAGGLKLRRITIQSRPALMALSTRAWLNYTFQSRYHQDPLSYERLESITDISFEACPNGLVAVAGNSLRFITIDNLGTIYNQTVIPLRYTPRRMAVLSGGHQVAIIESDPNEYNEQEKEEVNAQYAALAKEAGLRSNEDAMLTEGAEEEDEEGTKVSIRGPVPPADGKWASCIRILEASTGETKTIFELSNNEAAFSICTCKFEGYSDETFLVVGVAQDLVQSPVKRFTSCSINVFRMLDSSLQLLHKTEVEDVPYAMMEYKGKLLVGIGRSLRVYTAGKKKLLKKMENKSFPSTIVKLHCSGDRIFVGDLSQSVFMVKYRETSLTIFADDTLPRFITCMAKVDHNTVACGDKFGNVFTLRLPENVNDDASVSNGSNVAANLWDQGVLNGAANKVELLHHYYLGDIPTSITCTSLKAGHPAVFVVATISGGLFAIKSAPSKAEGTVMQQLEMFMRQEYTNLCQRDHLSFRSFYQPVKNMIDASLLERFMVLPSNKQEEFAQTVDYSVADIMKKLEELRNFL